MLADLGRSVVAASTSQQSCTVEMLAGDPAAAERELRRDFAELEEMGEKYFLSTAAGELARAVYAQGRYAEAEELTRMAEELSAEDDLTSQALWRSGRAKALARRGLELELAVALAEDAVERMRGDRCSGSSRPTRSSTSRRSCVLAGRQEEARLSLEEALGLFVRKGERRLGRGGRPSARRLVARLAAG